MRPALCVLFLHHRDDAVTRHHYELLCAHNPDAWIVPLVDAPRGALPGAVDVRDVPSPWDVTDKWRSCDAIIYRWFLSRPRDAERYLVLEWDCRVDVELLAYYRPWLDADVVAARVDDPLRDPGQLWFKDLVRLGPDDRPHAAVVKPIAGTLFTHAALTAVTALAAPGDVYCELRLGTAIRRAGLRLRTLDGAALRRVDTTEYPWPIVRPGFYHAIKVVDHDRRALAHLADPTWVARKKAREWLRTSPARMAAFDALLQRLPAAVRARLVR